MKFLKGLALTLLSFLLFLSLSIFGLVFMLNSTILDPDFVTSEVDKLDVSSLVEEILSEQPPGEGFGIALVDTINELEPLVKGQLGTATHSIYDYLLGKKPSPELALTLRDTLLSSEFANSLIDKLDLSSLAAGFLSEQIAEQIPGEMEFLVEYLDEAIAELEPTIKAELTAATDPILDYLIGESQSFSIVISLEPVKETLRTKLWQAFMESPPPELAMIPPAMREQYFGQLYQEFSEEMPSTFELDETLIGDEIPTQIADGLAEAEAVLEEARQYVSYFQLGYKLLIGLMVLLILGIILINRQVKDATRSLGITFLTYGAFEYIGIFVAKYFTGTQLPMPEIPTSLQTWLTQFTSDFLAPLEMISLGLLIGGIVLLIVSFVYPRWRQSEP
ncbi:hypothetical protein ACFLTG_00965 [Chloroflexota bacterium]